MAMRIGSRMPPLSGASFWINGEVEATALRDKPVLIHFWSTTCHMCKEQMPVVRGMTGSFRTDHDLRPILIHVPRSYHDRNAEALRETVSALGVDEPCAADNDYVLTKRFANQFVPAYFLFDRDHKMRARAAGAHGPSILKRALEQLLSTPV